jgi:ATP-dependent Clp protease ATP-binding subunit ClpA
MFEKFTVRARRAVVQAGEEARARHHDDIGTEHLLLGLIAQDDDPLTQVLQRLGLEAEAIRKWNREIVAGFHRRRRRVAQIDQPQRLAELVTG